MKPLSQGDVATIAALARLDIDPEHRDRLSVEMSAILEHMDALAQLDTEGVDPMTHAVPSDLPLRDDEVAASLPAETAIAAAPDHQDGQFRVPAIIEPAGS